MKEDALMSEAPIAVIGLGYVGLPLAVGLARSGRGVIGYDASASVVALLQSGQSHVQDVTPDELAEARALGLFFTHDSRELTSAEAFIICVPTPLAPSGFPDLTYIERAGKAIAPHLLRGSLVILESTTYPGTTEELLLPILEAGSGLRVGPDVHLAFSPERIDPGNPSFKVTNTPKVVGGFEECCCDQASSVYAELGIEIVRAKGLREAELSKLLENTYRHINIALVNEMVKFCHSLDIDLNDAIRCASTKPFGFQAFYPGPGVGGHCIPIDPNYLSYRVRAELGYSFRFVELAQEINASMPAYVVSRIQEELNAFALALRGSRILIAGVTYKQDVADVRESPAVPLVEILMEKGAQVRFLDPFVESWTVAGQSIQASSAIEWGPDEFDCAVILQHHAAFSEMDFAQHARIVLDTRGRLTGDRVTSL